MLSWFQALMPREERFFDLFERHAETPVAGSHALTRRVLGPPSSTSSPSCFFGLHVAQTVGAGIASPEIVDDFVIFAALTGAIVAA